MTRLILVRHGESNVTVQRIIGGPASCTGLSDLGRQQAAALAARLAATGEIVADVIISSTYPRAIETASVIASSVGGAPVQLVSEVGEHFPGPLCDGMTYEDYVDRFGGENWESSPYERGFPGGETLAVFQHRVASAIARIVTEFAGKTVVIVCHGGVIDRVVRLLMHTPPNGLFEIYTLNTSVTEFELARENTWRLIRYNDAGHLAGLPRSTPRTDTEKPNAASLELRPVTPDNLDAVSSLRPGSGVTVQRALLDAHLSDWTTITRAAFVGAKAIGFVVLAAPQPAGDRPFDGWYLWRLAVDQGRQRNGYGRRIVELAGDLVPLRERSAFFASWDDAPQGSAAFFQRLGFVATETVYRGETIGRLETWPSPR